MHQTPMNNMAVGAVGIQGCGGVPGVTHMQGGIQHNIGVPGSQTSAHLHGQVMSSEDERKVNHIKEFEIVVASIYIFSSIFNIEILHFNIQVVNEFCHLLEKSKQLFNGLRDMPQYGHKQWQAYFGRTFDIYTKLWKFQQQHRAILDQRYGLKRWQIGEIASKIGQLYYHY